MQSLQRSQRAGLLSILILFLGFALPLAAQEDFFSPVVVEKQVAKSFKHDFISVIHGPGQVRFEMPLGSGLGARGLHFQPKLAVQLAQKTSADQSGSIGWGLARAGAGNRIINWMNYSSYISLFYNAKGASNRRDWILLPAPHIVDPQGWEPLGGEEWKVASFDQEGGSLTSVADPGQLILSASTQGTHIFLPDGTGVSTFDIPESQIAISSYADLLAQFGYTPAEFSSYGSTKGTSNTLLFSILGITGQDISLPTDTGSPVRGAGRYVLVKDNVAYEYEYFGFHSFLLDPDYTAEGDVITGDRHGISQLFYRLAALKNKFGDKITFSYTDNDFDYIAELFEGSTSTGKKITVALSRTALGLQIPDAGCSSGAPGTGNIPNDRLVEIKIEEIDGSQVSRSIRLQGGIRWGINSRDAFAHTWPYCESGRMLFQPTSIQIEDTPHPYTINISYQWLTGTLPYGGGLNTSAVGISQIDFPGGETYKFTYAPMVYHAIDDSEGDWEPMAWPLQSMEHQDSANSIVRTTTYKRKLPLATNVLAGTGTENPPQWQYVRTWLNRDSYEAEVLPDGRTIVRKFVSPATPNTRTTIPLMTEPARAMYNAYYQGTLFEERTYPANVDWESGVLTHDPNVISLKYYDEWDASDHFKIDAHPYGVAPDTLVSQSVYSKYYPTRVTSWDAATGIATIKRMRGWDKPSSQWTEDHDIRVLIESDPWTHLGLSPTKLSDSLSGQSDSMGSLSGSIDRQVKTAFAPLNGSFLLGDWTRKDFLENGAYRLPSIYQTSNAKNGVTLTEETRATDNTHIRKEFSYQTETIGVPASISLASDGLYGTDGSVGVNLGYDSLHRLNSVQKVGSSYASTRVLNFDGTLRSLTDINGLTYAYQWDALGRLLSETRPNGESGSGITYDDGTLTATWQQDSQEKAVHFNAFGNVVRTTRKSGPNQFSHQKSGFDLAGRKIWESAWLEGSGQDAGWDQPLATAGTRWAYDAFDREIEQVDPNGIRKTTTYSGLQKIVTMGAGTPLASSSVYTYDLLGRLVQVVDPLNQVTTYTYDSADRIVEARQFSGTVGTGLAAVGAGSSQARSWVYDKLGRLVVLDQPESGVTYYTDFDLNGKAARTLYGLPRGWRPASTASPDVSAYSVSGVKWTLSGYDSQGRLTSLLGSDGLTSQTFTWDEGGAVAFANGKLTTATDGGVTRALSYNGSGGLNGRLTGLAQSIDGQNWTQTFAYFADGSLKSRSLRSPLDTAARTQTLQYDAYRAVPNGTSYADAGLATLTYSPTSWALASVTASNNVSSYLSYDADQVRLHRLTHMVGQTTIKDWTYSYDELGRLLGDSEDAFGYDVLGRLTSVASRDLDPGTGHTAGSSRALWQSLDYDAYGNRKKLLTQQILNWPAGAALPSQLQLQPLLGDGRSLQTYEMTPTEVSAMGLTNHLPPTIGNIATGVGASGYDAQGNLTALYKTIGDATQALSLSYDALGRIRSMADAARNVVEVYFYDDQGLRVLVEIYQGSVAPQNLQKKQYRIYNEARQLVSEYELGRE